MPIFRSVNDSNLLGAIQLATKRVDFFAPGVSQSVCDAFISCTRGGGVEQFLLALDGDEDTYCLGYCDSTARGTLSTRETRFKISTSKIAGNKVTMNRTTGETN